MKKLLFFSGVIGIVVLYFSLSSLSSEHHDPNVLIFTQVPASTEINSVEWLIAHPSESRIVSISKEDNETTILTEELYAAAFPAVSYDLSTIVFSAKLNKDDPWQLWTMKPNGGSLKQLFNDPMNCVMPAFLPDGKIVFSKGWESDLGGGYQLFTCDENGENVEQISFHPHEDLQTTVLHDGRLSFLSSQVFPEREVKKWMVMRPDGTKCDLFYQDSDHHQISGKVHQNKQGELFYIERCPDGNAIVQTSYANPRLDRRELVHKQDVIFASVTTESNGTLLISQKSNHDAVFSLFRYEADDLENPQTIYHDGDYHSFDVITTEKRERPKILPTSVTSSKSTGLLLCQDVNQSSLRSLPKSDSTTSIIRIVGLHDVIGEVNVEADGSFLLQLPANQPLQLQSLNSQKEILKKPSSWIWLRSNERRGCVGCHEKKGFAPENIESLAIKKDPVELPASHKEKTEVMVLDTEKGGDHEN